MPIPGDFKKMFQSLSIKECEYIRDYLNCRIHVLRYLPNPKKSIEELNISWRIINKLKIHRINTVQDIIDLGLENIDRLENVGARTAQEIILAIQEEYAYAALPPQSEDRGIESHL